MLVHVIDVDSGNLQSLENAIRSLGYDIEFVKSKDDAFKLMTAEKVFLPGVGNFGHFMDQVNARELARPIKAFISSGKPIMGICVGLQSLFAGSTESPTSKGLGILPGEITRFDDSTKSVPHIGWNDVTLSTPTALYGIDPAQKYYFVHSYARMVSPESLAKEFSGWKYALGTYGDQQFVAALAKDNMFFTQFHPEKSGRSGLTVIKAFLDGDKQGTSPVDNKHTTGLSRRVIACLDVRTNDMGDIVVTKGDQYDVRERVDGESATVRNLGKPVEVAEKYYKQGADEVTFLNITSFRNCPIQDLPMLEILKQASKTVFVPLTVGGGIKDTVDPVTSKVVPALEVATLYFRSGADKVSIGSDAVDAAERFYKNNRSGDGTTPIETISKAYGVQAVVVSVDPKRVYVKDPKDVPHHTFKTQFPGPNGEEYVWYQCTAKGGRENRDIGAYELAQAVEQLGCGELLLNCIDKDGSNSGFDLELIRDVKSAVSIPVIASSGAGNPDHFSQAFEETTTDAALGAGMFHRNEYTVGQVKATLKKRGLVIRS